MTWFCCKISKNLTTWKGKTKIAIIFVLIIVILNPKEKVHGAHPTIF
jgi:hypothetical protein